VIEDAESDRTSVGRNGMVAKADAEPAAAVVYDTLRSMILTGDLAPGATISQVKLSAQLGVSRTPLREALRRLQQEGLIEAERNRRARTVGFDASDLEFVYTSRILYEALAIGVTVPRLSPAEVASIEARLVDMRAAKAGDDYGAWENAHSDFHRRILAHADARLLTIIASYMERGERYRRLYQQAVTGNWNLGDADHEAIVVACRQHDARRAVSELSRHLARTALSLLATMRPEHDPAHLRAAVHLIASA
jgi:DNA-binding GntR family transcriptional regulator